MLRQIVLLFGAAVLVAWLFRALRAPAIIGFLFTGILIGPSGFRFIDPEAVSQFADLGLIMLLFAVGLELSPGPLLRSGRRILVAAILQIVLTVAVALLGLKLSILVTWPAAIALALAITPSSTAIVLKQLADIQQTDSAVGASVTGISMVQDMMVITLMLFLPILSGPGETGWGLVLGKGLISLVVLFGAAVAARFILPILLRSLVRIGGQELMTLFAVLMACAGAWAAEAAGWSPALGACVAGLLLAETEVRHQLFSDIVPFRDVFNALFFIAIGMLVDLGVVVEKLGFVMASVFVVLSLKTLLAALAVLIAGWPFRLAMQVGMGLATISEFGFVLARESEKLKLLPGEAMNTLTAVIVGTMIFGAMLVPVSERFAMMLHARLLGGKREDEDAGGASSEAAGVQVVIVGFGLNGQNLARVLKATNIPYSVIEMNPALASDARSAQGRVFLGDAARLSILRQAGLDAARVLVIAINDPEATRRIVAQARSARPELYVLARTRYISELDVLYRLGANQVIPEEFETSIEIFAHVLKEFRIPDNVIEAQICMIRAGRYGMLRGGPATRVASRDVLRFLEASATQTVLLTDDSPAIGRTLRELDLRARSGASVIAVVRGGKPTTNPPVEWEFAAGDVLVLVGTHQQLDKAEAVYAPPPDRERTAVE